LQSSVQQQQQSSVQPHPLSEWAADLGGSGQLLLQCLTVALAFVQRPLRLLQRSPGLPDLLLQFLHALLRLLRLLLGLLQLLLGLLQLLLGLLRLLLSLLQLLASLLLGGCRLAPCRAKLSLQLLLPFLKRLNSRLKPVGNPVALSD